MQCSEHQDNRRAHTHLAGLLLLTSLWSLCVAVLIWHKALEHPIFYLHNVHFQFFNLNVLNVYNVLHSRGSAQDTFLRLCTSVVLPTDPWGSCLLWAVTSLTEVEVWLLRSAGVEAQEVVAVWVCSSPWSGPPHHVLTLVIEIQESNLISTDYI